MILLGYNFHLMMQGTGKLKNEKINCIHHSTEKYISFYPAFVLFFIWLSRLKYSFYFLTLFWSSLRKYILFNWS